MLFDPWIAIFQYLLTYLLTAPSSLIRPDYRVSRHNVIVIVRGVVVRLSSRPIVDGLLMAVGYSVVALLELPTRPRLHVTVYIFRCMALAYFCVLYTTYVAC